jgi:hypothetical protein
MTSRWVLVVYNHKQKCGRAPVFDMFTSFVVKEAEIQCDPATIVHHVKDTLFERNTKSKQDSEPKSRHVFASEARSGDKASNRDAKS